MTRHPDQPVSGRLTRGLALLCTALLATVAALAAIAPPARAQPCSPSSTPALVLSRPGQAVAAGGTVPLGSYVHHLPDPAVDNCFFEFHAAGLPAGVTSDDHLTLTVGSGVPLGRYPVLVSARNTADPCTACAGGRVTFQLVVATESERPQRFGSTFRPWIRGSQRSVIVGGGDAVDHVSIGIFLDRSMHPPGDVDDVLLTAVDLPPGVTASTSVICCDRGTVTLTPSSSSPTGTFRISLTGQSVPVHGPVEKVSVPFWISIYRAPGFSLSVSPGTDTAASGAPVTATVSTSSIEGIADDADLTVGSLPAGVTASLSSSVISASRPVTVTMSASTTAPRAVFSIPLAATSRATGLTATVSFLLKIEIPR